MTTPEKGVLGVGKNAKITLPLNLMTLKTHKKRYYSIIYNTFPSSRILGPLGELLPPKMEENEK